ncbi:MAG: hypothetical protein KDI52_07440 [Xanthomonadales bacterium]|nr:hypothetical protein [Xanthomonadales bacterium]MCB1595330.1 hypothetical protein [Xanthomonadales bacterium]
MNIVSAPVSFGELLDKITILEIKAKHISDAEKLKNVNHELSILTQTWQENVESNSQLYDLKSQLTKVNQDLWDIEDAIRMKEMKKEFDDEFIQIARSVYFQNDKRAAVKKEVNALLGSDLTEEKSYQDYT